MKRSSPTRRAFFLTLSTGCCGAQLLHRTTESLFGAAKEFTSDEAVRLQLIQEALDLRARELRIRERELGIETRDSKYSASNSQGAASLAADEEVLILEDNFDSFDQRLWQHEVTMSGGGNGEFQMYVNNRTNSYVEDGVLYIQPTLTADVIGEDRVTGQEPFEYDIWGPTPSTACTNEMFHGCRRSSDLAARVAINPIRSAQLTTSRSFSFQYGRVEMRAKLPKGKWIFPAFWMMPSTSEYGPWPVSGEIDIMEARGNPPNYSPDTPERGGYDSYSSCLHWGPSFELNQYNRTFDYMQLEEPHNLADEWHTFGLYWSEKGIYTYLDHDHNRVLEVPFDEPFWDRGELDQLDKNISNPWRGRGDTAPFDKPFYLIMNLAVGGMTTFFPENQNKPWSRFDYDATMRFWEARDDWLPTWKEGDSALKVDSVRVWQRRRDVQLNLQLPLFALESPLPRHTAYTYFAGMEPATMTSNGAGSYPEGEEASPTGSSSSGGSKHSVCANYMGCLVFGVAVAALAVGSFVLVAGLAASRGWGRRNGYQDVDEATAVSTGMPRRSLPGGSGSNLSSRPAMLRCESGDITCEFGVDVLEPEAR